MSLKNYFQKSKIEVGCDEAGRGCLAGPVYAAAVILDPNKSNSTLNDSKKLSSKKRIALRQWIEENAVAWSIGVVTEKEIDEINILNASFLAMHRAIDKINTHFDSLLIDGNRFKMYKDKEHHCIVKGDGKIKSIAAASILAKTHRDEYMENLSEQFKEYAWENNYGYPTKQHREAIKKFGTTEHHRLSFKLLAEQTKLEF